MTFVCAQYTKYPLDDNDRKKILFDKNDIFFYSSSYFLESLKNNSRENYKDEVIKNTQEFKTYKDFGKNQTLLKIAYFNDKAEYSFLYFVLSNINCEKSEVDIDIAENINLRTGFKNIMDTPKNYKPINDHEIDKTLRSVISMRCKEKK